MTVLGERPYEPETLEAVDHRPVIGGIAVPFEAALIACLVAGVLVRAFHVLSFDFPLNDGGLFYSMTRDLQDAGYRLPAFTSYNGGDIPFAYPPLGFYLAGLLDDLTPMSLLDAFRVLPWLATSLTLPAFYLLARSLLTSRLAVLAAVFAFALIPRGYIWLLMGGGVTRSLGLLFAILALYAVCRVYREGNRPAIGWAALFCGLTVLSHLETAWFLAFSIAIFFVAFGRTREAVLSSAVIAAGTLLIAAPWWVSVLAEHGTEPFLAAAGTGGTIVSGGEASRSAYLGVLRFISTSEPLFPVLGTLALFGGLACLVTRRYLLVAWWAAIVLLEVRGFPTYTTLPVAMLAGIGITEVLLPLLSRKPDGAAAAEYEPQAPSHTPVRSGLRGPLSPATVPALVLIVLAVYAGAAALLRAPVLGSESLVLEGLSGEDRRALSWVEDAIPEGSRFLVVPDTPVWEVSKLAEWFPALTGQISVSTVQGSEWVNDDGFELARAVHPFAFRCGGQSTECLDELVEEHGVEFSYVYIRQVGSLPCCGLLVESLQRDPAYELLYDGPGAIVFGRASGDGGPATLLEPEASEAEIP